MADYGLFGTARDRITGRQKQLDQLTDAATAESSAMGADSAGSTPTGGMTQAQFAGPARSEAEKAKARAAPRGDAGEAWGYAPGVGVVGGAPAHR